MNDIAGRSTILCFLLALLVLGFTDSLDAQAKKDGKKEIPPVEDMVLTTKDGVLMKCSWYAGINGKKSVPVVLLHGWEEDRQVYARFAAWLQKTYGYAVLVPDLRGHGDSTKTENGKDLELKRFGRQEVATVLKDIEQCSRFLQQKNNEGELNLEMLVIVAAEETSLIATAWAISDWSWPDFNNQKQGKFVKAMVLLSPKKSFEGLSFTTLSRSPIMSGNGAREMPLLIAVGASDDKVVRETKSIESIIKKRRPPVKAEGNTPEEMAADLVKKTTVFFAQYPSAREGTSLLNAEPKLASYIAVFINSKVAENESEFGWHELPNR